MSEGFSFWQPPTGHTIKAGADQLEVEVPSVPLPLLGDALMETPSDADLGKGLYAYLRQFPDCDYGVEYAQLLKDGYPHFLADLAAQAVMIDHKEVDSPYLLRQITCLKIMALIEPGNASLHGQIGISYYQMALMFQELPNSRRHLLSALKHLNDSHGLDPLQANVLNHLAQVNYLIGDYPLALNLWGQLHDQTESPELRLSLQERIGKLNDWQVPDYPLSDDLETIGQALVLYSDNKLGPALKLLKGIEERGYLLEEFSLAEFHYLSGMCHLGLDDHHNARQAFLVALDCDPDFAAAKEQLEALGTS